MTGDRSDAMDPSGGLERLTTHIAIAPALAFRSAV
jgi:hypothetical protein